MRNFPRVELSNPEILWLQKIHQNFLDGKRVDPRIMKTELWGQIPAKFKPHKIDNRLLLGTTPTLLGIWHIDPNSPYFDIIEKIIITIRNIILNNPQIQTLNSEEIANSTGYTVNEV